ncbi:hypothetical protein PV326_012478, partial [Microctonus aethiopoides]
MYISEQEICRWREINSSKRNYIEGIVKSLLVLWFTQQYSGQDWSLSRYAHKINKRICSTTPSEFVKRMPRSLLWVVSSFPFENLNGKLRALVTDTRFAQLQICSRLSILMNIPELTKKILRDRNSAAVAFCDTIINSHKKYIVHPIGNKMFIVGIFKNIPLPMIVRKSLQAAE